MSRHTKPSDFVPNPKTSSELLALPEWKEGDKAEWWPNPRDQDTVIVARDSEGRAWVQQGKHKRRLYVMDNT